MGDAYVQVAPDSTGKKIDASELTVNSQTVERQRISIGDPASGAQLAVVTGSTPDSAASGLAVRQIGEDITACSFAGVSASSMIAPEMTQLAQGTGVTVSQSAGNLVIGAGTTANAEWLARSNRPWHSGLIARLKTTLSQRITNNNFAWLLADKVADAAACTINSATSISVNVPAHGFDSTNIGQFMMVGGIVGASGVPGRYAIASIPDANTINFTVSGWPASGSCTVYLFGWSWVRILYNGTTATAAAFDCQRRGWSSGDTTLSISTTASPGHVVQIHNDGRIIAVSDFVTASTTSFLPTSRGHRVEGIPDEHQDLYLYMWSYNGTSAPASSTTWIVGFWSVEQYAVVPVALSSSKMAGTGHEPIPVLTSSQSTVSINAGSQLVGDIGVQYRNNATGAASSQHLVAMAGTNSTLVKGSAGRVLGWSLANTTAAWVYLKLHNAATSPTAGSGVVRGIGIAPNTVSNLIIEGGIGFSTGIGLTLVTGSADSDATAVTAGAVVGELFFI